MTDKADRKLVQIPVARFAYRYEAEFAAGFLADAGIPYRLQIDDPGLGMPMSDSATLWVAGIDERRAREVLDFDGEGTPDSSGVDGDVPWEAPGFDGGDGREASVDSPAPTRTGRSMLHGPAGRAIDPSGNIKSDLNIRERGVALVGSVGALGLLSLEAIRELHAVVPPLIAVIAGALLMIALIGRAPSRVASVLAALSGDAP